MMEIDFVLLGDEFGVGKVSFPALVTPEIWAIAGCHIPPIKNMARVINILVFIKNCKWKTFNRKSSLLRGTCLDLLQWIACSFSNT
jgi:hypothetical protein